MLNLETVNTAALAAMDAGDLFCILIVRCLKTGGRFVSVRSVSPQAFVTGLKACAKDVNFGAYNSPILESIRKYGVDGHSISLHSSHKTRRLANMAKKELVERQAISQPAVNLNWNRPVKNLPTVDANGNQFFWKTEEQVAEMVKAKRARAKARAAKVTVPATTEAVA